jgi:HSP20 family molecular chaperone IbpA
MFARDPFFSPFFFRRPDPFDDIMPVLRSFPMLDDERKKTLVRSSLGYEIKESDGAYEIAVQIPDDFDASDMTVELENDGTVLHISGELKIEDEGVVSEQYFDKRFTVGENVDTENIQANFHEGLLVLKAPKLEPDVAEEPKRAIPISKKPHSMLDQEQVTQTNYSDAFDESDWAETGKEAGPKDKGKGAQ